MMKAFDERRKFVVAELNKLSASLASIRRRLLCLPQHLQAGLPAKQLELKLLDDMGICHHRRHQLRILRRGYLRVSYANSIENIGLAMQRFDEWLGRRNAA